MTGRLWPAMRCFVLSIIYRLYRGRSMGRRLLIRQDFELQDGCTSGGVKKAVQPNDLCERPKAARRPNSPICLPVRVTYIDHVTSLELDFKAGNHVASTQWVVIEPTNIHPSHDSFCNYPHAFFSFRSRSTVRIRKMSFMMSPGTRDSRR